MPARRSCTNHHRRARNPCRDRHRRHRRTQGAFPYNRPLHTSGLVLRCTCHSCCFPSTCTFFRLRRIALQEEWHRPPDKQRVQLLRKARSRLEGTCLEFLQMRTHPFERNSSQSLPRTRIAKSRALHLSGVDSDSSFDRTQGSHSQDNGPFDFRPSAFRTPRATRT